MILAKHQRIRNEIKAKIARGIYGPGSPLPSQQQLMSEYGVAQGTVRQALERLQADGLIVSHRGKGSFVSESNAAKSDPQAVASMGLMIISNVQVDWIVNDQLLRFQRAAAKAGYDFSVRVFDFSDEQAATQWALRHTGVVVWGACFRSLIDGLLQRQLPVVMMGELLEGDCPGGASWIRFDPDAMISTAIQLMAGLGHQRIWFVNRGSSAYFRSLSKLFAHHAAVLGVGATAHELVLERPEDEASLIEHLAAAEEKPSVLLIEGDIRACRFVHLLQQSDWPVPQRIGLLALGAAEANRLAVSDLSRIISPPDVGVARAAEALAEMIETGRVVRHTVSPKFFLGRTCIPIEASVLPVPLQ